MNDSFSLVIKERALNDEVHLNAHLHKPNDSLIRFKKRRKINFKFCELIT